MKIVFCWPNLSGYMCACWRALAAVPGVEVGVLAWAPDDAETSTAYAADIAAGVDVTFISPQHRDDREFVARAALAQKADVIFITGWFMPAFVALASDARLASTRFMVGIDTPWRGDWRQHLARFKLRRYLARMSAVFVPGERAWKYAVRLGVPEERIHRGMYSMDFDHFSQALAMRPSAADWPRKFLYAGRFAPEKGLDVLLEGYRQYREQAADPWALSFAGTGPLRHMLAGHAGVTDLGFVQPADQPALFAEHGALVLASSYEPWGVVVAEAAASGLPLLCSNAVGAAVDLVRPHFNGLTFATGSAIDLARAMSALAQCDLPLMGRRSHVLAEPWDARQWAMRIAKAMHRG